MQQILFTLGLKIIMIGLIFLEKNLLGGVCNG